MLGLALLLAFVVFQGAAQAATFNVDSTGDGSDTNLADGVCATATGDCTLRAAIEQAASGDTVSIPAGTYTLTLGSLSIFKSLTLAGARPEDTIIQASTVNPVETPNDPGVANFRVLSVGGGNITISGVTIRHGNASPSNGGGIRNSGTLTLTNSTVSDNAAGSVSGGIDNLGTLTLASSTVSGNTAPDGGGGIWNQGTLTLTNSTVSGNTTGQGGGIGRGGGIGNGGATVILTNTIVSGNSAPTGPDCEGAPTSLGHNLIGDDTGCGFTPATGDLVNVDPILDPLGLRDNGGPTLTIALLPGSPAIDSGDDSVLGSPHNVTTDQRGAGFPRLQGAHVDMGAFEAEPPEPPQASPFTVTKTGDSSDGLCGVNDCSLREAIASGDSGDAITIPIGVYTLTLGSQLIIDKNLTLTGASSGDTIIQAATAASLATHRVLITSADSTVTISSVTVRFGRTGDNGGGIHKLDGTLTLANVTVSDNTATGDGAGVYSNTGLLVITGSRINNNTAFGAFKSGGGVFVGNGTGDLTNSTFSSNSADDGGAIGFCCTGAVTVTGSTLIGNTARDDGGAIIFCCTDILTLTK